MDDQDHARLIRVSQQWERMYGELFVKAQRLSDEVGVLREALTALLAATDARGFGVLSYFDADAIAAARAAAAAVVEQP